MAHLEEEDPEVALEAAEAHQLLQNPIFLKLIVRNLKKGLEIKVDPLKEESGDLVKTVGHIMGGKIVKTKTQVKIKIRYHQKLPPKNRQQPKQKQVQIFRLVEI